MPELRRLVYVISMNGAGYNARYASTKPVHETSCIMYALRLLKLRNARYITVGVHARLGP